MQVNNWNSESIIHKLFKPSLAKTVLERRNRAFRILYDTVLEVAHAEDSELYAILCRNLRKICNAELVFLYSYDSGTNTVRLEAMDRLSYTALENPFIAPPVQVPVRIPDTIKNMFKEGSIIQYQEPHECFLKHLPEHYRISINTGHNTGQRNSFYLLSCAHGGDILAFALVKMQKESKMKMKDMVDTYLGLAGVTIQRANAVRALKISNLRFQTLLDSSPVGIMVLNDRQQIVEINSAALDMICLKKEFVIGRECHAIICSSARGNCPIFDRGHNSDTSERTIRHRDGREIPVLKNASLIDFEGERFLIEVFVDLSCRIKAESEKVKLEKELFQARKIESISVLAGGIAHDFKNILSTILGNITLVKMDFNPEDEIFSHLTSAEKACMLANELSQQLLTFSKGGAPVKKNTSIAGLIRDSADFAMKGSNIKREIFIPSDLYAANVDPGQISQVINNIIINACQAMPNGGSIRINCKNIRNGKAYHESLEKRNYIKVVISDEGIGIPEKYLPNIYDPYFTTKDKNTERGSGLGLATAYSIIQRHNGLIDVKSKVGIGTTFSIYLPANTRQPYPVPVEQDEIFFGEGKILVMDDEKMILNALSNMLSRLGYQTDCAEDGATAIQKYIEAKQIGSEYDAVIMDLTVPGGMGGEITIKKLREIDPNVKAIVSSGYSNSPIISNYRDHGFAAFIRKPVNITSLSTTLNTLIKS